jgi:hypothetical protein
MLIAAKATIDSSMTIHQLARRQIEHPPETREQMEYTEVQRQNQTGHSRPAGPVHVFGRKRPRDDEQQKDAGYRLKSARSHSTVATPIGPLGEGQGGCEPFCKDWDEADTKRGQCRMLEARKAGDAFADVRGLSLPASAAEKCEPESEATQ